LTAPIRKPNITNMSRLPEIRKALGLTQAELAVSLGMSQGNVSFYENGQTIPPAVAARLIEIARARGHELTFDAIYAPLIESGS
jgi:putative transcriptional regulator